MISSDNDDYMDVDDDDDDVVHHSDIDDDTDNAGGVDRSRLLVGLY